MDVVGRLDQHFRDVLLPFVEPSDRGLRESRDGVEVSAVGHGGPAFNTAAVHAAPRDPLRALRWARDLLEGTGRPYSLLVPTELLPHVAPALEQGQLVQVESLPGMVLEPLADPPPVPPALRISRVATADDLAKHATALARGFGAPDPSAALDVFTGALLEDPRVTMLSGFLEDQPDPVATSVSVVTDGVAGVFGVTVADSARRWGAGTAMTWAAVSAGAERGADVAGLQATAMGQPVYARMGFRTVRRYARYAPAMAAQS
ncbi:MAG: hypothetical protein JWO12_241 [Frankiales bacterium]|nr:hypothetical protein [Frankiales bacterium]